MGFSFGVRKMGTRPYCECTESHGITHFNVLRLLLCEFHLHANNKLLFLPSGGPESQVTRLGEILHGGMSIRKGKIWGLPSSQREARRAGKEEKPPGAGLGRRQLSAEASASCCDKAKIPQGLRFLGGQHFFFCVKSPLRLGC